jgi:predicted Holliday junction resolvase-like endonuclease
MDIPIEIILMCMLWFMVAWVALAVSLNLRDARKKKRLQRARQQQKAKKTVPVEQVLRLAEWNMEQWMTEKEKLN